MGPIINYGGKEMPAADLKAGDIILSRDKRTKYQVQDDGSWKKMAENQYPGEFEEVNG